MIFSNYLAKLRQLPLEGEDDSFNMGRGDSQQQAEELSPILKVQQDVALILQPFFSPDGLVAKSLEFADSQVSSAFFYNFLHPNCLFLATVVDNMNSCQY